MFNPDSNKCTPSSQTCSNSTEALSMKTKPSALHFSLSCLFTSFRLDCKRASRLAVIEEMKI